MAGNTIIIILPCVVLGQIFTLRSALTRRLDDLASVGRIRCRTDLV